MDFQPRVKLKNEILNVTEQMRLVGLILTDDLKWKIKYRKYCKKGLCKIMDVKKIKKNGG